MKFASYRHFIRSNAQVLQFGFLHTFFSGFGQSFLLGIFMPFIAADFLLDNGEYGLIYALATLSGAMGMTLRGSAPDKYALDKISLQTALLLLLGCGILFWSPHVAVVPFGIFLMRFSGQGMMSQISQTLIGRYFDKDRGKALSLVNLGYPASELILPLLVGVIVGPLGWRGGFLIMGLLVLSVFIPVLIAFRKKYPNLMHPNSRQEKCRKIEGQSRTQALKSPFFWISILPTVFPPFAITILFLYGHHLQKLHLWNLEWQSLGIALFGLFRALSSFGTGFIIDHWNARLSFAFYLIPISIALVLLSFSYSPWQSLMFYPLAGLTTGAGGSIKGALFAEVYGTRFLGSVRSLQMTTMIVATACGPWLSGFLMDQNLEFRTILQGITGLSVFALVLAICSYLVLKLPSKPN